MPKLTRRAMFRASAGLIALTSTRAFAQNAAPAAGPFTLPPLPYGFDANEPHIDATTMTIHHDRHHAAYVANLNAAAKDYPMMANMTVPALLQRVAELPDSVRVAVRNNGGGHANHSMFWTIMGGKGGQPTGELATAITGDFGGLPQLQTAFNRAGTGVFGSGWVFITVSREGKLAIVARPNQDTPLMDGNLVLMGNDVWEHAYYLKYQNRRADYLAAWWNVVDWTKVGERYAAAKAGTLEI